MDENLSRIIDECWANYINFKDIKISKNDISNKKNFEDRVQWNLVPDPSIPILWFGDLELYKQSKIKIVTASLNPSSIEFSEKKGSQYSFIRFRNGQELYNKNRLNDVDKEMYIETLNEYFDYNPYWKWFNNLNNILSGFNASYNNCTNDESANIVLHTDVCTQLATDPTWGNISNNKIKNVMYNDSFKVWEKLMDYLKPDIVLISVGPDWLNSILKEKLQNPKTVKRYEYKANGIEKYNNPYDIKAYEYKLINGGSTKIIWGNQRTTPFADLGGRAKEIGPIVLRDF